MNFKNEFKIHHIATCCQVSIVKHLQATDRHDDMTNVLESLESQCLKGDMTNMSVMSMT